MSRSTEPTLWGCLLAFVLVCAFGFAMSLLVALPAMWLWNWLVPSLFSGPAVTYWQTWGVLALLSLVGSAFRSSTTSKP